MRIFLLILILLLQSSCQKHSRNYSEVILENGSINTDFIQVIEEPEKALLTWYLFVYGNECTMSSDKIKCKLLGLLNIENECDNKHIDFLYKWFGKNKLMQYKLQKCPNLPFNFAIQNTIERIVINRNSDTLSLTIKVKGINESQEKNWDIEQTEFFIIKKEILIKI